MTASNLTQRFSYQYAEALTFITKHSIIDVVRVLDPPLSMCRQAVF